MEMTPESLVIPTVFVVDDDAGMRAALRRLIAAAGLAVETYASAAELLEQCDLTRPGILLLDVMMPGMTGLELQESLLARGITSPVIFLTGSHSIPIAVAAIQRGAVDFVEKPFDNADLLARLQRALQIVADKHVAQVNRAEFERRLALLTPREREVMDHVVTGKTSKEIARALGASHRTIEIHRTRVMAKMEAASLADLVRMTMAQAPR
jgi:FixJ family two-component response regulator